VHLKTCLDAAIENWPPVAQIVSATAPLSAALAARAEQQFGCPLREIYGSTETGAVATRRTREEEAWRLHQGVELKPLAAERACLQGGHLARAVELNDRVRPSGAEHFLLLGRNSDMVKIAGKRVSLGDLNHRLQAIPGVEDGVFIDPEGEDGTVARLCAVVVAPQLDERAILEALKPQLDPVCLPRPLYRVDSLPRNEAGKLPRKALLQLLGQLRKRG
jgi:acyl-coenzyme A synthetase/AMP-(fatty) acid ligase